MSLPLREEQDTHPPGARTAASFPLPTLLPLPLAEVLP